MKDLAYLHRKLNHEAAPENQSLFKVKDRDHVKLSFELPPRVVKWYSENVLSQRGNTLGRSNLKYILIFCQRMIQKNFQSVIQNVSVVEVIVFDYKSAVSFLNVNSLECLKWIHAKNMPIGQRGIFLTVSRRFTVRLLWKSRNANCENF